MKPKLKLEYSEKKSFFVVKLFLKKLLPHFLWTLQTCSRYLESVPNTDLYVNEKIVTVRHNNMVLCQEKSKKLKFEKWYQKCSSNILTNVNFWGKTFSQRSRWNFLWASRTSSRNLEGPHNLDLCIIKNNSWPYGTPFQNISKNLKKRFFSSLSLTKCYTFCTFLKNDDLRYSMT